MEVFERIKVLRKHLKLSQAAFGKKLGVNRDVINNIENNRLAKPEQKLSLIKLMCKEFSVNEDWLLHGSEPMFIENNKFDLEEYLERRGMTELEREIMFTYFDLDPATRKLVIEHFRAGLAKMDSPVHIAADYEPTVEELEEQYKKRASGNVSKTAPTVSSTTAGIRQGNFKRAAGDE